MSTQRSYAQRKNNIAQQLIPTLRGISGGPAISSAPYYSLTIPTHPPLEGASYYVDLSAKDTSGNLLDLSGYVYANDVSASIINFVVDFPTALSTPYTGLEFTIFFKNPPLERVPFTAGPAPLLTIGLIDLTGPGPLPYILSPLAPWLYSVNPTVPRIANSITFKNDGSRYNVISSGPAGFLGLYLFAYLLGTL